MIAELVLLGVISSVYSQSLHHAMTPEELDSVFSVKSHSEVLEYDMVPVSVVKSRKRRQDGLHISEKRFGQHIKAWLNPTDGILAGEKTPVHFLGENPQNKYYPKVVTIGNLFKQILPTLYENHLHATTLAVNAYSNGKRSMRGFIGDTHIQPVPSHLMDHAKRHRRSVRGSLDEESDHENYHVVRKIPKLEGIHYSPPLEAFSNSSRTRRSIRYQPVEEYPEIIYPQILVLVDYYILNKFENDWTELIVYVLSFWNGVDMRYRDIIRPRVRLNINGIVIATDPNLFPYLHVGKFGPYAVDIDDALVEKANWLKDEVLSKHIGYFDANDTYDVAVTMTQFTLCGAEPDCGVLGLARPDGACIKYNVAIVKDFGGFSGIMTAAHELGHLFGIHHDGERNRCSDAHGYIMTTFDKFTPQAFDWSPCSLRYTDQFLKSGRGRCLYNHPFYDKPFQRYLPGKLMDANRQCKILRRGYATVIDDSICTQLKCNGIYTDVRLPEAAEGTPCGQGRLCLHGRCDFESLGV